jgi:virginiamycin B lyase
MNSLLRVFIVCIASAVAAFSQSAPPLNPPPQASGYKLVFSEDFASFNLSPNGYGTYQWYPGIYFDAANPSAGPISVSNSTLNLQWNRASGQTNTSIEGCAYKAGNCNTYRYGYFQAKMKWDVTTGAWPAFWMITEQGIWGEQHVGELDIFEGQGNDPTHFYGTINEWDGPNDLVSTNSPVNNRFPLPPGDSFSGWHTYGLLWVPGKVTWYFDNVEMGSAPTPAIFDQQDFFIILGSQEGNNWTLGNLTGVSSNSIDLDVDWVQVYQSPVAPPLSALQQTTNLFADPPALTLLTTALPNPNSTLPYAVEPQAAGGTRPYKFAIASGALPEGLELAPTTGMISSLSGVPVATGPYRFTLEVTDAVNSIATRTYSGVVQSEPVTSSFTSYPLPVSAGPNGIANGPDEDLWFTAMDHAGGNLIGRISTAGVIAMTDSVNPSGQTSKPTVPLSGSITAGSPETLWVLQPDSSAILAINPATASQVTYYPTTTNAVPTQITASRSGAIWFTEAANSKIGHITPGGSGFETPTPSPNSSPLGLVEGPGNLIVFTEPAANKIGFISETSTQSGDFPIPTANSLPQSIVLGPDNAFWFTESKANKIGRIDYSEKITETPVPAAPGAITLGPDGALYFTESGANKIGRITIGGQVTEFAIPGANSDPTGVVAGPDGSIWFTENSLSRIGRLSFTPPNTVPPVTP